MIPVIAIDGPSASGKGTIAQRIAEQLDFHYLDSGALYRLTALAIVHLGVNMKDELQVSLVASSLDVEFKGEQIWLAGQDVSSEVRTENVGNMASTIATYPSVRAALLARQRAFRARPGLVADGRDMGSVVFPDATLKVFLTASIAVRAERRYKQLISKGLIDEKQAGIVDAISMDLQKRDEQDQTRATAPLKQQADAKYLDTSAMSIKEVIAQITSWFHEVTPQNRSNTVQSGITILPN
jgi:cytidylate kinase